MANKRQTFRLTNKQKNSQLHKCSETLSSHKLRFVIHEFVNQNSSFQLSFQKPSCFYCLDTLSLLIYILHGVEKISASDFSHYLPITLLAVTKSLLLLQRKIHRESFDPKKKKFVVWHSRWMNWQIALLFQECVLTYWLNQCLNSIYKDISTCRY